MKNKILKHVIYIKSIVPAFASDMAESKGDDYELGVPSGDDPFHDEQERPCACGWIPDTCVVEQEGESITVEDPPDQDGQKNFYGNVDVSGFSPRGKEIIFDFLDTFPYLIGLFGDHYDVMIGLLKRGFSIASILLMLVKWGGCRHLKKWIPEFVRDDDLYSIDSSEMVEGDIPILDRNEEKDLALAMSQDPAIPRHWREILECL